MNDGPNPEGEGRGGTRPFEASVVWERLHEFGTYGSKYFLTNPRKKRSYELEPLPDGLSVQVVQLLKGQVRVR